MKKFYALCLGVLANGLSFAQGWVNGGNALAANGSIGTNSNHALIFETNGVEQGRITNAGNWGIGSLATNSKLTINSAAATSPLRVQIGSITKFIVNANGGVSIGALNPAPSNGLYVSGQAGIGGLVNTQLTPQLQVRQASANRAILWQHQFNPDYWSVGIGATTLNTRFEFNGMLRSQISSADGAYLQVSDASIKTNVELMQGMLEKVMQLKPSVYNVSDGGRVSARRIIGMIAQEVEPVLPEVVYEVDGGLKSLNYSVLSVVAIKALQEQQQTIATLKQEVEELKTLVRELSGNTVNSPKGWMKQNSPNPVSSSTSIQYSIPADAKAARILLTNAKGQQMKVYNVVGSGTVNVTVATLPAGTYVYSLVVDGATVSTRKLIVAR